MSEITHILDGQDECDRGHVSTGVKMDDNTPRLEATANVRYHVS